MIFKNNLNEKIFYVDIIFHLIIFLLISLNIIISHEILEITVIVCLFIFLSKDSNIQWYFPLIIFLWGIYQDLIIGSPIGYSGLIFLFFLLLNQLSNYFGIFTVSNIRFLIYFLGLCIFLVVEYIVILLHFDLNLSLIFLFSNLVIGSLIYFPIEIFIGNKINFNVSKK